jgi:hypothetical protein
MGGGDVSQSDYEVILEICRKYSRGTYKIGKGPRDILERIKSRLLEVYLQD